MEYGEAISPRALERAFQIARRELAAGRSDMGAIAVHSVAEAYCVCVVSGGHAPDGEPSPIHASLIATVEAQLAQWITAQESN